MRKIFIPIFVMLILLTGCGVKKYKSLSLNIETGDDIVVKVNTNGGYNVSEDKNNEIHSFAIKFTKDDKKIATGYFDYADQYDLIVEYIESEDYAPVVKGIKKENREDGKMLCYQYLADGNNICRVKIKGSNTMITIYGTLEYDELIKLINRLSFSKK